jgi:hypothetical protein
MEKQIEINGFLVVSDEANALVIDAAMLNQMESGYDPSRVGAYPVNINGMNERDYVRRLAGFWGRMAAYAGKQHLHFQAKFDKIIEKDISDEKAD